MVKLWGNLAPEEISSAMNTVFGAAIGAFFGVVLPTAASESGNIYALSVIFAGTLFMVLILQLLMKMSIRSRTYLYVLATAFGLIVFFNTRFFIELLEIDPLFFDAVFSTWLVYTIVINLLTHSIELNEYNEK